LTEFQDRWGVGARWQEFRGPLFCMSTSGLPFFLTAWVLLIVGLVIFIGLLGLLWWPFLLLWQHLR
jgi:hypothetical protein